jgi:SAM-dependent methyltransferase
MIVEPRNRYKTVWNALSRSSEQATIYVIGEADEPAILAAGEVTRHWLEQTVGINQDDVILEIGCGIGRVGQVLAPRCRQWIGCDVSPNMLAHAQRRLAIFDNVQFVELSGFDLGPIEDVSVDLAYSTVVFMHLDEWDRYNYILEARRVLRPGGRIFIDNFNLRSEEGWRFFEMHWQITPEDRPSYISKSSTPQEIEVYLRRAGFQDINIIENGAWVQAYAMKPQGANPGGGLIFAPPGPQEELLQRRLVEYEQELQRLHAVVAEKNAHIAQLKRLLARIENGRVMRILRWVTRK